VIMANMSEEWRSEIVEGIGTKLAAAGLAGIMGAGMMSAQNAVIAKRQYPGGPVATDRTELVSKKAEKAKTVASSGGAGGEVTVDKSYPATLNKQKGVKSTGPTGTEYFTPNFPGSNVPNRAETKFKSVASQQYEKVPSNQRVMDTNKPVSVTDRTKYDPSYKPINMRKPGNYRT